MKYLKQVLIAVGAAGGGVALFLGHSVLTGAVIAATHYLRYWAYPTFFGINVLLTAFVFLVVWPFDKPRIKVPARFERFFSVDERRFEKGFWRWAREKGLFVLILVCSIFPGPLFAALVIRFFNLPAQKAWSYAIVTTLVSTFISISVYLGALDGVRSFLSSIFT